VVKILGAERGCWISGCSLLMWICLHRYRSLLKTHLAVQEQLDAMKCALDEAKRIQVIAAQRQAASLNSITAANSAPSKNTDVTPTGNGAKGTAAVVKISEGVLL
jgi:hypothetical protein